jgi:large subunit ribosomal protein L34
MLCLRYCRLLGAIPRPAIALRVTRNAMKRVPAQRYAWCLVFQQPSNESFRTLTSLAPRRPTIFPTLVKPPLEMISSVTSTGASSAAPLDLLPKISAHPALSSTQVRCGPRNTFSPSHFVRKRRHGFLSRVRTRKGRATLQRRRAKKRSTLSH